ncbi:MAG: 3-hydroxyacyl-CoA dehydrogenase family protein [Thermoplasmatota archaeon]
MFVQKVGVVGAGAMGAAIAEVMALNGKQVVLKDVNQEFVDRGLKMIDATLNDLVTFHAQKGANEIERIERENNITLTEDQKKQIRETKKPTFTRERTDQIRKLIKGTTTYDAFSDVDFVVEAVIERMDIKKAVFAELDKATPSHVVLATNTSALPITDIAAATSPRRRPRVLGTHFFNPPYSMPLIEIIPALETNRGVVEETVQFFEEMRNHRYPMLPIVVKETPGFVVNRVLGRALTEAFNLYEEGIASARDIDKAMKAGAGWPMGPLELADMVGVDVLYHVSKNMRENGVGETQRRPIIIDQLFASGHFGKKSGRGFYDYTSESE